MALSHWEQEVPGARFFRADLHLHTLDDHPSANFVWPAGISGEPDSPQVQRQYARAFLQAAISSNIEVLGLTPHAVKSGSAASTSATWRIVEAWQQDNDDDGTPFRDKIFAIFPGFEPSLNAGAKGLHLLFLFDPTIGRDAYVELFAAVMQGIEPWQPNSLTMSPLTPTEALTEVQNRQQHQTTDWSFLCLAPHAFNNKGLFDTLKAQVLSRFPSDRLAGIELKDNDVPEDVLGAEAPEWQRNGLAEHRHALYHASDAYSTTGGDRPIGHRFTYIKLATPTIEALRQAFLAADSRTRPAYTKDLAGHLSPITATLAGVPEDRTWLRSVTVSGGSSFFGGEDAEGAPRATTFTLSPDLTCVIGTRLTGKSTFLDGLRLHYECRMPDNESVASDISERAERFISNSAVDCDVVGSDAVWRPLFLTQRELQSMTRDSDAVREVIFDFTADKQPTLRHQLSGLDELDEQLEELVGAIQTATEVEADGAQAVVEAQQARDALDAFAAAGFEQMQKTQQDAARLAELGKDTRELKDATGNVAEMVDNLAIPKLEAAIGTDSDPAATLPPLIAAVQRAMATLGNEASSLQVETASLHTGAQEREMKATTIVKQELSKQGKDAGELAQFEKLRSIAGDLETRTADLRKAGTNLSQLEKRFTDLRVERESKIVEHRGAMQGIIERFNERLGGRLTASITLEGSTRRLGEWVAGFKNAGLTRWWNQRSQAVSATQLIQAIDGAGLGELSMSTQVSTSFMGLLESSPRNLLMLRALRSPDTYELHLVVESSAGSVEHRPLSQLSGGAQISVLLTALLESEARTPLVIDQPEDEIDSTTLWNTIIPSLRSLKGRRQVILATHDANIVVNGDADQIIQLAASSDRGRIEVQGAIEDAEIRGAIVDIVDGGADAFDLRRTKYGF